MKLIIDISEDDYRKVQDSRASVSMMRKAIGNGTPLEQESCDDAISRQAVNTLVDELARAISDERCFISRGRSTATIMQDILDLPPVTPAEKVGRWIPVKWHEITDEEREREGYPKDWVCFLDSKMPYDGQRILVTTKGGYVELDECYSDDGQTFSLDSGYDWVDDIIAWMPLPEPYKIESEEV